MKMDRLKFLIEQGTKAFTKNDVTLEVFLSDFLKANGVIAPPCNIGDEIYVIPSKVNYELNKINGYEENNRVYRQRVEEVRIYKDRSYMLITCGGLFAVHCEFYGHTWFLDRVKAEEELRKRGTER